MDFAPTPPAWATHLVGDPTDWLRAPLRDWAEGLFNETRLKREGYLNAVLVRRLWQEHLTSRGNWGTQLWCVAMFQAWLEKWTPTA